MKTKEIKISVPEGYEIDKENSTFECIKFKKLRPKRWRNKEDAIITGYYTSPNSSILKLNNTSNIPSNHNVFATKKQVKSALAMAQLSQIMANDERFGGIVTDEEWSTNKLPKYYIKRLKNGITIGTGWTEYTFLAFHSPKCRDLFLQENEDLIRDYLMID